MPAFLTLVVGGARSGKSRHAEGPIAATPPPWAYIVTAQAQDDEMRARIALQRGQRGEGWRTLEAPLDLAGALATDRPALEDCLTLWLTNPMRGGHDTPAATAALDARAAPTVLLGNEVGLGIVPDNALARVFRDAAGRHRAKMAKPLPTVLDSFARLRAQADIVLAAGAGSASEINLRHRDIAKMAFSFAAGPAEVPDRPKAHRAAAHHRAAAAVNRQIRRSGRTARRAGRGPDHGFTWNTAAGRLARCRRTGGSRAPFTKDYGWATPHAALSRWTRAALRVAQRCGGGGAGGASATPCGHRPPARSRATMASATPAASSDCGLRPTMCATAARLAHDTAMFDRLGRAGILARRFAQHPRWLRFGLPRSPHAGNRLRAALG